MDVNKEDIIPINHNRELFLEYYNPFNNQMMDDIFKNTKEESILNNEKIDEDELDDDNDNEVNIITESHNNPNLNESNQSKQEYIEDEIPKNHQDISHRLLRQPNTKYRDFYQFLINHEKQTNSNMEINKYDSEDAQVMLMFMLEHQIQKLQECAIHRHTTLEKESSNMGIKERKLSTRNYHNYTIEEFLNLPTDQN